MDFLSVSEFISPSDLQVELDTIHGGRFGSFADGEEPSRGYIELPCILGRSEMDQAFGCSINAENEIASDVRLNDTNGYGKTNSHQMWFETSVPGSSVSQQTWFPFGGEAEKSGKTKAMDQMLPLLSSDGDIDARFFPNLKDVLPLMEPFTDQKGNQRIPFSHRASLVYTPAPCRSGATKKVLEVATERQTFKKLELKHEMVAERVVKEECNTSMRNPQGEQATEEISRKSPILEPVQSHRDIEELIKKQLERTSLKVNDIGTNEFAIKKPFQTKAQIGVLQEETLRKEHISDAEKNQQSSNPLLLNDMPVVDVMNKENIEMKAKILELQHELWRKDYECDLKKQQLSQKQLDMADLQSILEKAQANVFKKNQDIEDMEKEIEKLQGKVATLSFQLEVLDILQSEKEPLESKMQVQYPVTSFLHDDLDDLKKDILETEGSWFSEDRKNASEKLEMTRRMYLASIIAARNNPGEEFLMLVSQLRQQLQDQRAMNARASSHVNNGTKFRLGNRKVRAMTSTIIQCIMVVSNVTDSVGYVGSTGWTACC